MSSSGTPLESHSGSLSRSRVHVSAAARGISSNILWQLSSRVASFGLKAIAVRALGPTHFAFAEVRLALLSASSRPAALGIRKIALRSKSPDAAAALVLVGTVLTTVLAAAFGIIIARRAPLTHIGPICVAAIAAIFTGLGERGYVFATRAERYEPIFRARAMASIVGSVATTASVVILPSQLYTLYSAPLGLVVYALYLWWTFELAASGAMPRIPLRQLRCALRNEDMRMAAIASWQAVFRFILENGESVMLDVTCMDAAKGAYRLAGNIGSLLARFFSEALEEQTFNIFARLAPAFQNDSDATDRSRNDSGDDDVSATATDPIVSADRREMRAECINVMQMSLKTALLISLLIAFIGPHFSYAFLRLLYGSAWADDTPAAFLLGFYFVYLAFMAANGVSEAFVSASASSSGLQNESLFSLVLSIVYMVALYGFGRQYGASGIIGVNCANMFVRTVYALAYFMRFTRSSWLLLLASVPHHGVLLSLVAGSFMCRVSGRMFFDGPVSGMKDLVVRTSGHAMSGAFAVALFCVSVLCFEKALLSYIMTLRRSRSTSTSATTKSSGIMAYKEHHD